MPDTTIDGRQIHHRQWGSQGSWVTLIHGGLVHSASWSEVGTALGARHRVLAADLAGYGRSAPHPEGPTIERFSADLVSLWSALGIARSVVVGFSLGGFVALETALTNPTRVSALGLIGTAPAVSAAAADAFTRRADHIDRHGLAAEVDIHLARVFSQGFHDANHRQVARYAEEVAQVRPEVLAATFRSLEGFDRRSDLGRVRCPALVMVGSEDAAMGRTGSDELAAGLPTATSHVIPGAGHTVHMERPDEVVDTLLRFLGDDRQR